MPPVFYSVRFDRPVGDIETEGLDQMQSGAGAGTGPGDGARIIRDLGLKQNDVDHSEFLPATA